MNDDMRNLIFIAVIFFSQITVLGDSFKAVRIPKEPVVIELWHYNEWNIDALIAQFVKERPVVVQAGVGDYKEVLPYSNRWPQGKIYVFEPNPQHFKKLKDYRFYFNNVRVYEAAVHFFSGTAPFYLGANVANKRIGSLLPAESAWQWYYRDNTTHIVDCLNLEEWAKKKKLDAIDVLVLNIGGAELLVLKSIPNLLTAVSAVAIETHAQEFRQGIGLYPDVLQYMEERGFFLIKHWHIPNYQGLAVFAKKGLAKVFQ